MSMRRNPDKLITPEIALEGIVAGSLIAVGGVLHDNKPMALERALLRTGLTNLKYIGLSGAGYDLDLLIARGGLISEIFVPVVTFDNIGFAPAYRWAVEEKSVKAHIVDVASIMAGYFAGASGVPFHPVTAIRGSDVTRNNPLISEVTWRNDEKISVVAAITPDVALIHAQEADQRGNARIYGSTAEAERLIARSAKRVIISCDRLVPTSHFEKNPMATTIPSMYVDAVCHLPFGAHPTGSPTEYGPDAAFLRAYWKEIEHARRANDRTPVIKHLNQFVDECRTHDDYLALMRGDTFAQLSMGAGNVR